MTMPTNQCRPRKWGGVHRWLAIMLFAALSPAAGASSSSKLDVGLWHYNAGLYAQAIPRLLSAVPAVEKSDPSDPRLPTAYVALGTMAASDKEYQKAEEFFSHGLMLARTRHADDTKLNRNALVNYAEFLSSRSRTPEALPLFVEAAEISERTLSVPRLLHAIDLDNLGVAYDETKDLEKADECTAKALQIMDGLEQTNEVVAARAVVHYNLAYRLAERGKDAEAEQHFREALAHVGANGEQWRINTVLTNYAEFLRKRGRETEAKALEDQVKK